MTLIRIKIDIHNPEDILSKDHSKLNDGLSDVLHHDVNIKEMLEKKVCENIIRSISHRISSDLKDKGIEADIDYAIESEQQEENEDN